MKTTSFILLEDQIAHKEERNLRQKKDDILVLQGSLWQLANEYAGKYSSTGSLEVRNLISKEFDGVVLQAKQNQLGPLREDQYELLIAMNTCEERYKVFKDEKWLREGIEFKKGDIVYLIEFPGLPAKVSCQIKYKGPLTPQKGTWFGIELSEEFHGKGAHDGTFRNHRYFTSPTDSATFVPICKIRRCHDPSTFKNFRRHLNANNPKYEKEDVGENPPLKEGERVVWVSDNGPEFGTVKWIGFLHDTRLKEWTVGVEFDNPIGTGTGKYKDRQLFRARQNHASLVPILGLIKESVWFDTNPIENREHEYEIVGRQHHFDAPPLPAKKSSHHRDNLYAFPRSSASMDDITVRDFKSFPSPNHNTVPRKKINDAVISDSGDLPDYAEVDKRNKALLTGSSRDLNKPDNAITEEAKTNMNLDMQQSEKTRSSFDEEFPPPPPEVMKNFQPDSLASFTGPSIYDNNQDSLVSTQSSIDPLIGVKLDAMKDSGSSCDTPDMTSSSSIQTVIEVSNEERLISPSSLPITSQPKTITSTSATKKYIRSNSGSSHSRSMSGSSQSDTGGSARTPGSSVPTPIPPPRNSTKTGPILHSPTDLQSKFRIQTNDESEISPVMLDALELDTDLDLGSMVEVLGNPPHVQYGVVKWIGYYKDKMKPIVGLEMEEESTACTEGTFMGKKLFDCPSRKALFVYISKCRKDPRFEESLRYIARSDSQVFGNEESPDIEGSIPPPTDFTELDSFLGKLKGIQGHHNSCYMDATLFSMFGFTTVFDTILHRPAEEGDVEGYKEVQTVLKNSIVNPLREKFYVRADKVLRLRTLLDKLGSVKGLTTEEKDPEEFLNSLLQQIMKAEPFLRLSNGQESYLYQLFLEKDERLVLPTTQQLVHLSFLQSDIKLAEVPACLILQMPRFGKDYKMYKRIVPSLYLDITDILQYSPRECTICGSLATFECKDCYQHFGDNLDTIAFCTKCKKTSHAHVKRANHRPRRIEVVPEYLDYIKDLNLDGEQNIVVPRERMELFAVVCIERSHYVSFVKCGSGENAPWLFFDSMADRMGEQHGYNVPEVKYCPDVPKWLSDDYHDEIVKTNEDKLLPELMKRLLCDSYLCMYQNKEMMMYK